MKPCLKNQNKQKAKTTNEDEKSLVFKLEFEFSAVPFWASLIQLVEKGLKKMKKFSRSGLIPTLRVRTED